MANSNGGDHEVSPENRLDRIEAILERFIEESDKRINSNAKAIESLAEDRRRIDAQLERTDRQISQLTRDISILAQHQATMFEIVQESSKDRVTLAENMASIAQSLAKLAGRQ